MISFLKKNKVNNIEDESIKDKSKFVVVGFTVMIFSFLIFVVSEIYTSISLSKQDLAIAGSGDIEKKTNKALLDMAIAGKNVNEAEYTFIKEIMKFMSPAEFQNFKNSISGMANQFNVQINSLNEGKSEQLGKEYSIYYIEYQFLSTYENLTFLKDKIAETKFKVNIIEEKISRESPTSQKILAEGIFGVYIFNNKEKLLKEKKALIESFKKIEADKAEDEVQK
jgi:hypothetical protein